MYMKKDALMASSAATLYKKIAGSIYLILLYDTSYGYTFKASTPATLPMISWLSNVRAVLMVVGGYLEPLEAVDHTPGSTTRENSSRAT